MKRFVTEDSFWQLFPSAAIGIVVAEGMKPASEVPQEDADEIARLLDRANIAAERHLTSDTISENEPVKAWREAYRAFKTKKGARCSIENLLKRVLKSKPVGPITPAAPVGPVGPIAPAAPAGPVGPTAPAAPAGPVGPVGPPAGPVGPMAPAGPVGPVGPAAPAAPAGPVGPIAPGIPAGPAGPGRPGQPGGPGGPGGPGI